MSAKNYLKGALYSLYCSVTGRGGGFLAHKKEYHRRRIEMERRLLAEAKENPDLFCENVCPACGVKKEPARRFSNRVGFSFAVCPDDGTTYLDPVPTEETLQRLYNDPAESYLWDGAQEATDVVVKPYNQDDYEAILRMVKAQPEERLKMLEIGCATGAFLMTASRSFDVEGVELNDKTASIARVNGFNVRTGRVQEAPGEEVYSLIVMLQVLEHIVKPDEALREVQRLLKPGGYFYINVPNIDSSSFAYLGARHMHVSSYGHVSLYNKKSLALLGARCGLELVEHEYCGGRDLQLHDALTFALAKKHFAHRMSLYNSRLFYATRFLDTISFGAIGKLIFPRGNESYQRALFRKPASVKDETSAKAEMRTTVSSERA